MSNIVDLQIIGLPGYTLDPEKQEIFVWIQFGNIKDYGPTSVTTRGVCREASYINY